MVVAVAVLAGWHVSGSKELLGMERPEALGVQDTAQFRTGDLLFVRGTS